MAAVRLLPCPFCGCSDIDPKGWPIEMALGPQLYGPMCGECGAMAESVERWNCRPFGHRTIEPQATMTMGVVGSLAHNHNARPLENCITASDAMVIYEAMASVEKS